jgi:hypothetical protein
VSFANTVIDVPTALTYALITDPSPLQVSLAGDDSSTATFQLVITNQQASTVTVHGIAVSFMVGPGAGDLTDLTSAALDVLWQPKASWTVVPPASVGAGLNTYTLMASDSGDGTLAAGDSIVVTFAAVPINEMLGTTTLTVAEKTSSGGGTITQQVSKFPYGFAFHNLQVKDPAGPDDVAQVAHGTGVRLTWDGSITNPAAYTVLVSTSSGQQTLRLDPSRVNELDVPALYQDAQFVVQVEANDATGQSVTHALSAAVAVAQPDLAVTSVALGGQDLATQLATMTRSLVPTGTIAMWSGAPAAIPAGWALCDGTNGTPDLLNRFILGADPAGTAGGVQPNTTGGAATHTHAADATVGILPDGAHAHGVPTGWYSNSASSGGGVTVVDRDARDVASAQTQTAGLHTHQASASVTIESAGNLPPYYALCFIIKQI